MATPDPADPLRRYGRIQQKADREIVQILRNSLRDLDRQLSAMEQRVGVGAIVRRTQLGAARIAILRDLADTWARLGEIVEKQAVEAATQAARANGQWDEPLLRRMGLTGAQRKAFQEGLEQASRTAVQLAINRNFDTSGLQRFSLSERVYHSAALAAQQVDRRINSALARGLSAREFSKEMREMIRPDTPGGVSFAAKRLARTEINHAFHYAQVKNNEAKPWVNGMRWRLSGSHPKPDVCDPLANNDHANLGPGVFKKTDVPGKPHPQCLCHLVPVPMDEDEFVRRAANGDFDDYMKSKVPEFTTAKISMEKAKPLQIGPRGFPVNTSINEIQATNVKRYTSIAYGRLNSALRAGRSLEGRPAEIDKSFSEIIAGTPGSQKSGQVFRNLELNDDLRSMLVKDATIVDNGWVSTSTNDSFVRGFSQTFDEVKDKAIIKINTPKGTRGIDVDHAMSVLGRSATEEDEFILPKGSKFKITKVDDTKNGLEIVMDMVL